MSPLPTARPTNRLAHEASPYLLQHAGNPVDWRPWGSEALSHAKREDKPILLSIGYAACHWCHVMERESFEDQTIAEQMNQSFVCIKVDREERPDLDQIYQLVIQLMGRSGGWPLTVFLTPDQRPFFAGTYFPPEDRHGMPGFPRVLSAVAEAFHEKRGEIALQAQEITQAIDRVQRLDRRGDYSLGPDLLEHASRKLIARFDEENGGFGSRPKFPNTMSLDVLLRRGALEGDSVALGSVKRALDRMRAGGIWDHLRGGFHRYSTDERWLVPHFEKMLYDNALLLRLYVDGFRVFGDEAYAETARAIVGYLFAEMQDESGAFYASQDADSEGEEGTFFVWTPAQMKAALEGDAEAYEVARAHFGVTDEGNFEGSGASVLSAQKSLDRVAIALGLAPSDVEAALARAREKLLEARDARPRPARDDKVLASWNALAIGALSDAGRALNEPSWVGAAARAFDAIEAALIEDGRVRRYLIGGAVPPSSAPCGFLDDQAYTGNAALDLFMATHEPRYLTVARAVAEQMLVHFWDKAAAGFYFTADDAEPLIARSKDAFDQAIPSGASMAARLCLRLSEVADPSKLAPAERALNAIASAAAEDAFALGSTVCVLDRLVRGSVDVVVVGDPLAASSKALVDAAFSAYLPNGNIVLIDPDDPESARAVAPLAEGKTGREGASAAYVCRGKTCSAPIESPAELSRALSTLS